MNSLRKPWAQFKYWSVLALIRLPVVCLCKVREPEDGWRDGVDRGSRLPSRFLRGSVWIAKTLRYQRIGRFERVFIIEEILTVVLL